MANRSVADDGFAFNDLGNNSDLVVREQHANAFTDRRRVAANRDEMSVAARANRNIASETEHAFRA
jgi:hypothetical protein